MELCKTLLGVVAYSLAIVYYTMAIFDRIAAKLWRKEGGYSE